VRWRLAWWSCAVDLTEYRRKSRTHTHIRKRITSELSICTHSLTQVPSILLSPSLPSRMISVRSNSLQTLSLSLSLSLQGQQSFVSLFPLLLTSITTSKLHHLRAQFTVLCSLSSATHICNFKLWHTHATLHLIRTK